MVLNEDAHFVSVHTSKQKSNLLSWEHMKTAHRGLSTIIGYNRMDTKYQIIIRFVAKHERLEEISQNDNTCTKKNNTLYPNLTSGIHACSGPTIVVWQRHAWMM
jgi:hypothetical protein